jgi:hypothetical protein
MRIGLLLAQPLIVRLAHPERSAPGAYERNFYNASGEIPISEGAQRAPKALDKRSETTARMEANLKAPDDAARVPSPLLTHVRDKFKKTKPTAVPRILLDQRLLDPSSLGKEESLESAPSPARTVNPDDPNEDAEMQLEGNQNPASVSKSSDSDSSSSSEVDEDLFIEKLVQLASAGKLSTKEEVLDVYLDTFGEDPEVSLDFCFCLQSHKEIRSAP